MAGRQLEARAELADPPPPDRPCTRKLSLIEARRQRCRQARYERYQAVVDLGAHGDSQLTIAKKVGVSAGTVARWLHARGFPERQIRRDRQRDRARFLQPHPRGLTPARRTHYSSGRVAALLMKPEGLSAAQQGHVNASSSFARRRDDPAGSLCSFAPCCSGGRLGGSRDGSTRRRRPAFVLGTICRTLQRDMVAVTQALTTPWSNGPVEGHINRLKMIKRQMYGRAPDSNCSRHACSPGNPRTVPRSAAPKVREIP
jgi:hypothetical protein